MEAIFGNILYQQIIFCAIAVLALVSLGLVLRVYVKLCKRICLITKPGTKNRRKHVINLAVIGLLIFGMTVFAGYIIVVEFIKLF